MLSVIKNNSVITMSVITRVDCIILLTKRLSARRFASAILRSQVNVFACWQDEPTNRFVIYESKIRSSLRAGKPRTTYLNQISYHILPGEKTLEANWIRNLNGANYLSRLRRKSLWTDLLSTNDDDDDTWFAWLLLNQQSRPAFNRLLFQHLLIDLARNSINLMLDWK